MQVTSVNIVYWLFFLVFYEIALWDLGRRIHDLRKRFNIASNCSCDRDVVQKNGVNQVKYYMPFVDV